MSKKIRLGYDILSKRAIETESGVNIDDALRSISSYQKVTGVGSDNHPDVPRPNTKVIYIVKVAGAGQPDTYKEWIWNQPADGLGYWECIGDTSMDLSDMAKKSEMSVESVQGDPTKKTIQLKSGLAQEVVIEHQDISGKQDTDFIAEYEVTQYDDIAAAYQAGKRIICRVTSSGTEVYVPLSLSTNVANGGFMFNGLTTYTQNDWIRVYKENGETKWTQTPYVMADQAEMVVTPGTGVNADKTTIQLKSGLSATVLTAHQDISGKQDVMSAETPISITGNTISISDAEYDSEDPSNSVGGSMTAEMVNILYGIDGDFREINIHAPLPPPGPNTLRFRFSDTSYNPSDAGIASAGNWVKQETGENVWDWTNNNASWGSCFNGAFSDSNNSVDMIAAGDTSGVTNMAQLFANCIALRSVALFDTGSATTVFGMFDSCTSLENVPEFDVSSSTHVGSMFRNCSSLVSIPDLDTSNVTYFSSMMEGCTSLTALPSLNTTRAYNVTSMCKGCVNIETGILSLYNQLRASTNIHATNHFNVFTSCGTNTVSGTAEWNQILCTWGGGYTPTSVTIDGKTYGVTQVSKYLVMTENLACSGGQWYNNDEATYSAKGYGKLYTWDELSAMTFPDEWRLPDRNDMTLLTYNLTASDWKSTSGWKDGGNGTNSTGLNMLPAGYKRTGSATDGFYGDTEAARIWYKYNNTGYYITLYYNSNAFDGTTSGGYTHHLSARLILQIRS